MAIKPEASKAVLKKNSVEILNTIRDNASERYQEIVPMADGSTSSIRAIGQIIQSYEAIQNEFLSAIYNRIGRVIVTSKIFYNPWAMFKKGLLEYGETVEEIFVNIAKVHTFDQEKAETEFMKREIPDVRSAFHTLNFQKFYKATISDEQLKQAFLSWQGVTDLIARIVDQLYTSANYDEFLVMKYMIGRNVLNGYFYPVTVPAVNKTNASDIVTEIKAISNDLVYYKTDYNYAGVYTSTDKSDQYIITTGRFDAIMDVNVLASAFNMEKAQFMGNRIQVDGFNKLDTARLEEIFKDDPYTTYVPFTEEELELLGTIPAILVDANYFMCFDNNFKFTEDYNGQGLYWQYWYHTWKTFSASPFANAVIFVAGTPTVVSVTVSPATATVARGANLTLTADVEVTNFAPKDVVWSVNSSVSTISPIGVLTVAAGETEEELTVTATSSFDNTKTGTATITIS